MLDAFWAVMRWALLRSVVSLPRRMLEASVSTMADDWLVPS